MVQFPFNAVYRVSDSDTVEKNCKVVCDDKERVRKNGVITWLIDLCGYCLSKKKFLCA